MQLTVHSCNKSTSSSANSSLHCAFPLHWTHVICPVSTAPDYFTNSILLAFFEERELTQIGIHHGRHTLHSLKEDGGEGVEAGMMGWVDHAVRDDGVLEELLRLTHLVWSAQFYWVAKAVQKPEEACLSTGSMAVFISSSYLSETWNWLEPHTLWSWTLAPVPDPLLAAELQVAFLHTWTSAGEPTVQG